LPISYVILTEEQLVLLKGSGLVTGKEVLKHLDALADDEKYVGPMKKLVDYRFIDSINITPQEAWEIAKKKKAFVDRFGREKLAFVSPADLTFGATRVHQALIDGADIDSEVFRRIEDALDWLDLPSDTALE